MIRSSDIYWLAGLLEGEGTFYKDPGKVPLIAVEMVDKDVIERAALLLGGNMRACTKREGKTQTWGVRVYGPPAVGWMYTLYMLLGERRKQQALKCIKAYNSEPRTYKNGVERSLFDNEATREILLGR